MLIGVYHHQDPFRILSQLRTENLLNEAAKANVELIFFNALDVDFSRRSVEGYILRNKTWLKETHPIPYIAINPVVQTLSKLVNQDLEFKIRYEIPFVLNLIDDKLIVQQQLSQTDLREHLIDVTPLLNLPTFLNSLNKYGKVILKSLNEHRGIGIMVISKNRKKQIVLQEGASSQIVSFTEVCKKINPLIKKQTYIIQPFIYSRTKEGRTFHIRIQLIRNSQAQWLKLSTIVDIADKGMPISNYQGVTSVKGYEFFCDNYGNKKGEALYRKVEKLSFDFADRIDSFYPFTIDELGIDFGVDADEKIWFYEANTGPEIIDFAEEREKEWAKHKIGYAKALATILMDVPLEEQRGRHFKATAVQ